MKFGKLKQITLLIFLLSLTSSCAQESEITVMLNLFENQNKINLKLFLSEMILLDDLNNNITEHKKFGIKKSDSTKHLYFTSKGQNLVRKIVKNKDTMLLYFKKEHSNDLKSVFKIDSLIFEKGKFLLDQYYCRTIESKVAWAKYYNEYVELVLEEKNNTTEKNYKETKVFKEFSKMRKKLYLTKYDYRKINHFYSYQTAKYLESNTVYVYTDPFQVNGKDYFWEFAYDKSNVSWNGYVKLIKHNLVDHKKEQIIFSASNNLGEQVVSLNSLKDGNTKYCQFVDANFDGTKDFIQGDYANQTVYLFNNDKNTFEYFEELDSCRLTVDSINKKLLCSEKLGRFDGHIIEKKVVYFKENGDTDFVEDMREEILRSNNEFYKIITKRKLVDRITVEKLIDTVKVKKDNKKVPLYQRYLKTKS